MARANSFPAKSDVSRKLLVIGLWDSTVSLLARMASKLRPEQTGARVAPLAHVASKLRPEPTGARVAPLALLSRVARKLMLEPTGARVAPLARPKQLLTAISNKTIRCGWQKRPSGGELEMDGCDNGEFRLWQKSILMGEKCEPLDFSGVIYYDRNGKQLDDLPVRSPRASPLPGYLCESAARREKGF